MTTAKTTPRIPPKYNGIQYNFCKNPKCSNYGVEPPEAAKRAVLGPYALIGGAKRFPLLRCTVCGETPPMKSNHGIAEELARLTAYLTPPADLCCPDAACGNHTVPVGTKKAYRSFGKAASGAKRYQCTGCGKTFSQAKPTQGQHETHQNIEIFKLLTNKVALSRIINILGISWAVLYHRIDFIHRQCLAFAAHRERHLKDLPIRRLYLAVDRQEFEVNWTERKDKRNVVLAAVASADNGTGYVFGMHPNFDPHLDKDAIEADAANRADSALPAPHKRYARLWLNADYEQTNKVKKPPSGAATLSDAIAAQYAETATRDDVEAFDHKTSKQKLPDYGIQIRAEYTLIAHFYYLKQLCGNVEKWRFYLDQESGIRSACLTAFQPEVAAQTAEAFYVRIEKDLTVDEKRKFTRAAKKRFAAIQEHYPLLSETEIKLKMLQEEIAHVRTLGHWQDRWVRHPLPTMAEANKATCWLTEHDAFPPSHQAWLYHHASLHAVDTFFAKIRRRLMMLERPIHSAANAGRTWNGYGAYNPAMVGKLVDIFRVVHNFIDTRKESDKTLTTPATRLGLAQAPLTYQDVLYFNG